MAEVQNQDEQVEQQSTEQPAQPQEPESGLSLAEQASQLKAEETLETGELSYDNTHVEAEETPPTETPPAEGEREQTSETVSDSSVEEVPISTAQQLVEHEQWDEDWFYDLKVPIKVDGESAETTIAEMRNSYQTQEAAEHRLTEAKAKVTEANEAISERVQTINTGFGVVAGLIQTAEQLILGEASASDLKQLETTDPTQYLIEKNRLEERRGAVDALKRQLATAYLQSSQQVGQQTQAEQATNVEAEYQSLKQKLPAASREDNWNWDEKGEAYERVVSYMVNNDLPEELVRDERNHVLLVFAEKARLYDEMQAKVDVTEKRLTTVPKVLKPGANQPKVTKPTTDPVNIMYPNG